METISPTPGGSIYNPNPTQDHFAPGSPPSFPLAPGTERSQGGVAALHTNAALSPITPTDTPTAPQESKTMVLDYTTDFPELPVQVNGTAAGPAGSWAKPLQKVRSSEVTQIFHLPSIERRHINRAQAQDFGESPEQQDCNKIAAQTGTKIELSESRDLSLTIVLTGKRSAVEEARKAVIHSLQTQASREIRIPKEHHRAIIGKEGKRLQDIERETDCRVQVPNRENPSDVIRVIGPKEGIEKAMHVIQLISDEQSKLAQEHLAVPRIFYPWIRGPNNSELDRIITDTGAKINMPPPTANSEIIVITGEKEGVYKAAAEIKRIYEDKKNLCKTVTCKVSRAQHRYVIGAGRVGLSEILRETGVSVEVPSEDSQSDTITLRGDPDKLGQALTLVYAKASSVITAAMPCPQWLHKFIIGQRGAGIRQIVGEQKNVNIQFEDDGQIYLEGDPNEVNTCKARLVELTTQLESDMDTQIVKVHPSYHRHIIGRQGSNISKLKQDTGVQISIPDESTNSDAIKIEGNKEGVAVAVKEISEIAKRMENEKAKDILIEHRFHKAIIGAKGEAIRELRDEFPGVNVSFPEPGKKSDVVKLRGPKDQVDKCAKHLTAINKDMLESNFQVRVPIFKDFHKNIIGKGGANIKKIREETSTKIDLPAEGSSEDGITITGKKANVEKAVTLLQKIQNELASIVTSELSIPNKLHARLIGGGGRLIHDISDQCGGVLIKFPAEKSQSDKISLRGPKDDVERAKKLLGDLAKDRELSSFQEEVKAKPELFGFLIGRGGTKIKKLRESHPDVRILFPRHSDQDQETIMIMGRQDEVKVVKKMLEELVKDLSHTVEMLTEVPIPYHRHFVIRGAAVVKELQEQFGGIIISFPKMNSNQTSVSLKGPKDCVEAAKTRISEIVADLDAQVTEKIVVPAEHHRALLSNRGALIQRVCAQFSVQIKFPERESPSKGPHQNGDMGHVNGDENGNDTTVGEGGTGTESPKPCDVILVTGRPENCEKARQEILDHVPISEVVSVPFQYHGRIIGAGGKGSKELMDQYDVNFSFPPRNDQSDEIKISGSPANVKKAVAGMLKMLENFEEEEKEKELRSFKVVAKIPPEFHSRIIGPRGQKINQLKTKYQVNISVPGGKEDSERPNDEIIIIGYEDKAQECAKEMESLVEEIQSLVNQEIFLDARVHPRLIGQKGKTIRKLMDQFGVDIRLPRASDPDPNLVTISGKSEDVVFDCIDHLRNLEEEYLQDIVIPHMYTREASGKMSNGTQSQVRVVGAPWEQPPDVTDMDAFPSMGGEGGESTPQHMGTTSAWGPRR